MVARSSVAERSTQPARRPDRVPPRSRPVSRLPSRGLVRIGPAVYPIDPPLNGSMQCLVPFQVAIRVTASGDILFPVSDSSIHEWTRS